MGRKGEKGEEAMQDGVKNIHSLKNEETLFNIKR